MKTSFPFPHPLILTLAALLFLGTSELLTADCLPDRESVYRIEKLYDEESKTWYFLTEIKNRDAKGRIVRLRHAHSEKPEGEFVRTFAERTGSLLAFNASTATTAKESGRETRTARGIQIIDGEIIAATAAKNRDVLGIKTGNELIAYPPGTTADEILEDGAIDALTAFTALIEDFEPVSNERLSIGAKNYFEKHPRQIIAQMENLDLLFLSCGGRGFGGEGMSSEDLIRILSGRGVRFAYMLDGGGSVSTVVKGKLITEKIDKHGTSERLRPNFLYLGAD